MGTVGAVVFQTTKGLAVEGGAVGLEAPVLLHGGWLDISCARLCRQRW